MTETTDALVPKAGELSDAEVFGAAGPQKEMTDEEVFGRSLEPPTAGEAIPEAFLDRVRAGQALGRILSAAGHEAKEGAADQTPTGYSDERLGHMIDIGVFHDPAKGRPGPIQMANEAVLFPIAQAWQSVTGAMNAGIHGAGGAVEQLVTEFGGSQGTAQRAKNEVINASNWAMIEGGMGRFSRPAATPEGVMDQQVGGLPKPEDFTNAATVLTEPKSGLTLREAPEGGVYTPDQIKTAKGEKYFKVYKPDGDVAAEILVGIDGNTARVEDILAPGKLREEGRGALGAGELRSVLRQFQAQHPEIKNITGERVSGAGMEGGYSLLGERRQVEVNLKRMWQEDGIHPAEAVHDAQTDAFVKNEITAPREEIKLDPETEAILTETGGKPGSLGAAATDPEMVPLEVQPASPPGRLIASAQQAAETLFDIGRDIQMKLTPMARGTMDSMATVKDYMNSMRRNAWDSSRIDTDIMKRFTPEDRTRMWNAMDEESLSLRLGEPSSAREHQGLATLTPEERAFVVEQDTRQQLAWLRARDLGMVEGEGIAMHAPRMAINLPKGLGGDGEGLTSLTAMGYDLKTRTSGMRHRKYMEVEETEKAVKDLVGMRLAMKLKGKDEIEAAMAKVVVARDIRAVNLATSQLHDAIAGRTLIENIKDVGKRTGDETVAVGFKPAETWFTLDHPAFKTYRPKFQEVEGKIETVKDADGKPVFEQVPIYVRGDFEGPLRSAMWGKSGETYKNMMALKGKTMGLIMNSPAIHNLVELGRAFPTMPLRIFKAYFDGNRAKHDVGMMHEAINSGLVPIGKRFFNQDISGMMEAPDLTPGRSLTAKVAGFIGENLPQKGMTAEEVATQAKQAVDKAGDFWHNTLLWDRIADLQMGLYVNFRGDMIAKGTDAQTASRVAAHMANRYAGALPKEAMSEAATKFSNFALFSRSFTFGNLGVMKDMLTGMPKDVLAQIERDMGTVDPKAVGYAKGIAQRKAMMTVGLDIALAYVGNSVLQSAFNVMLGDRTIGEEEHEYWRRTRDLMNDAKVHPLSLLNPFHVMQSLSATNENEPNRKDRVLVGYAKDGTAIYGRNPVGKIGEEFTGYFSSPLDMMRKKEGTVMRPFMQILSNDAGFGRKIYDPGADSLAKYAGNVAAIVQHLVGSQLPMGQINAFSDLVKGEGDKTVNLLQTLGPLGGFTFSKGAPGGPEVGVMYASRERHDFEVAQALPDIRRQIRRGDTNGAYDRMTELDVPVGLQKYYVKTTLDPSLRMSQRAVKDFYLHANPEERAQFDRLRGRPKPPAVAGPPQKDPRLIMNGPQGGMGIRG